MNGTRSIFDFCHHTFERVITKHADHLHSLEVVYATMGMCEKYTYKRESGENCTVIFIANGHITVSLGLNTQNTYQASMIFGTSSFSTQPHPECPGAMMRFNKAVVTEELEEVLNRFFSF